MNSEFNFNNTLCYVSLPNTRLCDLAYTDNPSVVKCLGDLSIVSFTV